MATAAQIAEVRGYISEPTNTAPWDDAAVVAYIDRATGTYDAAASIWGAKAADYAALVNVSESGSSRQLGSLQDNALKMAAFYRQAAKDQAASPPATPVGPIIASIVRP
jgi:hypothetical protein